MNEIILAAKAKINLTLDVLGKRADGFHEVAMIMQSLELADRIVIREADSLSLETDDERLPADESNLAYKAALLLMQEYGIRRGAHIRLEKNIPLAAGLAGGSSDAAAVIKGLARLWDLPLTPADLHRLGACLGSDVPFCFSGGTALATGRGEVIRQLPDLPPRPVVLAKPPIGVATAHVYQNYRQEAVNKRPDTEKVLTAVRHSDWKTIDCNLVNVLETVTIKEHPEIAAIKEVMAAQGAAGCLMSGSGPTVFCLVDDERDAVKIADQVRADFAAEVFVTKTARRE
jgi:4-diphosphocytidyl-2-C-methyl-D-erythritol kinase